MLLSVVIPAHNEEGCIVGTVRALAQKLRQEGIPFELVVVDDHSRDQTGVLLDSLKAELAELKKVENRGDGGFGMAVRCGLEHIQGGAVAVYMADASDTPEDLVHFYRVMLEKKVDCVFGTRFHRKSRVVDYPWFKLFLNRMVNQLIRLLFRIRYNDVTNAFKLYRRPVIEGLKPFLSPHFNLTVELPLKAIVRGYSYAVVPNDWINRKSGESKLKIKEMGSRYLFIIIYCFIEQMLSRGDYKKKVVDLSED
jgi:dolichol-phosphate mannosyltransferase